MKHIALLVSLTASLIIAASASAAEPAVYICHSDKGAGHYSDGHCTVPVSEGGNYEAQEYTGKSLSFKGKTHATTGGSVGSTIVLGGEFHIKCTGASYAGHFVSATLAREISLALTGCTLNGNPGLKAQSGSVSGEIVFQALEGEVGYLNVLEHKVGLFITPEAENYLAQFNVAGRSYRLHGTIPAAVTPTGVFGKPFAWQPESEGTIRYQLEGNEWQEPQEEAAYESEAIEITLSSYADFKG